MDSAACGAAATPVPALAVALAPDLAQAPLALPGLLSPSPLLSSGREVDGSERGTCLWRPWLSSTNDSPRQMRKLVDLAAGGATAAEVTKAESRFHHPVRLFWPKSRSFDYLYSAGEILLQNFPVQATINLYEDSDSEEEEEDEEEEDEEEK
ncbi:protein ripply1 isoform X1 [Hylobates moloch]|uniref:protein ripply1 isoform X1 n=1 Tax=Hylobates moloch TaxID=81572 RepID=UPI0013F1C754|nr:protein ripply1 isoform X1 [Hylobates moloch]XP_055124862.1 protein ripply1 isoform X1 [Symphalangus syndactylus]